MSDRASDRWAVRAAAPLVAAFTLALMVLTEPSLTIGWDEGYTLGREARVRSWFRAVYDPPAFARSWTPPSPADELVGDTRPAPRADQVDSRAKLFSADALAWFWPFAREEPHGHPPFYAIVGMVGDLLAPNWPTLPRARLGPMIAFSLAAGGIFAAFRRRWGAWPATMAAGAWALQPQMFALGHYAGYDALLSALWVGAILAFARAVESPVGWAERPALTQGPKAEGGRPPRWGWAVLFGVSCGWAADTKLTGWFLPFPFLAWTALTRSRRGARTLAVGGAVAALVLFAFNPAWWADPIGGVAGFFRSNLSRGQTIPIQVLFLGDVYRTPNQSLPWYNTLVWTAIATPVGFLAFAIAGAVRSVKLRDPMATLAVGNWLFVLLLRALPNTPGHDGIRLFLPAFGCLALAAGVGAAWAVEAWGRWGKALVAAALAEGLVSVAVIMPVPLSYFSPIVGGLPGAARLGMEPTYFWDALTDDALERLHSRVKAGENVRFANYPTSWLHLRKVGKLRVDFLPSSSVRPSYYVLQNRPGIFRPEDRRLVEAFGADPRNVLCEKFGVPLVWLFTAEQVGTLTRGGAPNGGAP